MTIEHQTIDEEIAKCTEAQLRDILYFAGKFYRVGAFGLYIRIERRKARASDWRVGLGAIGMAVFLSLAFALDHSLIPAFIFSAPYFGMATVAGMIVALWRGVRLSDWFVALYFASYLLAAVIVLPAAFLENNVPLFLAVSLLISVSLVIFLNIALCIYVLIRAASTPAWRPARV
jgi:peptidoglycan/LPS O-acetylase OafA/YrhL